MASFKLPCPSCENTVLIKNPNLIGTKVECPKCKYRFKVEEPSSGDKKDAKKGDAKKGDTKKVAGKNKKLVPILVGAGAVVILIVVAVVMFGGGKGPKNTYNGTQVPPNQQDPQGDPDNDGKDKKAPGPVIPSVEYSKANTTNLLPGQSVAVYRFNMNRVRESPAHTALVDSQIRGLFRDSMGFEVDEVEAYFHSIVGEKERDSFGVVKLKTPVKPTDLVAGMRGRIEPKPKLVKKLNLYGVQSNPFAAAVSHTLAMRSLLGDVYDRVPVNHVAPAAKPMGLCVFDTQHILIGDYAVLEKFLGELDNNGYPPFKTVMAMEGAAPPTSGDKPFTSSDTYRTIENPLKKTLDAMEADKTTVPLIVLAEKFDAAQYDPKQIKKDYQVLKDTLVPIAERTTYVSANVTTFTPQQLVATVRIKFQSPDDARNIAKDHLSPRLTEVTGLLRSMLTLLDRGIPFHIEFRDYTQGPNANMGIPIGPGMGMPFPGMGMPLPGMGPGPLPPMPMFPGGGEGAQPGRPIPGGEGMPFPGMGMGMDPLNPDMMRPVAVSHVDLGMTDDQLVIAVDLSWPDAAFRLVIAPRLVSMTNQIKGKMAVFATGGEHSWQPLAAAVPKVLAEKKAFPRGTNHRPTGVDRAGLPYPPGTRVSLFADLLPYMGRGALEKSLTKNVAWYDERNLPAPGNDRAGAWVPELLVPDYPQSAWRATSPLAPDHVLGATNYVAIAGRGLNIARANPNDKEFAHLVGMTGYDWGSKPEEVTDGLSNTIYMMQTPPGLQQPWIAGGGATVRGFDEYDPMGTFKYVRPVGTKQGCYALMGDGSVRFIPNDIDPKVLIAMGTRAGGTTEQSLTDINKHAPKVELAKPEPEAKADPKPADPKKADDKADDKKPADPKKAEDKKEPDPKAKGEVAPPPPEKK